MCTSVKLHSTTYFMRRIFYAAMSVVALVTMIACTQEGKGNCRIHGVVDNPQLNDKQIFLVPLEDNSAEAVDSVYIKDGKFEFVTDTCHMAQIIMDYHFRDGVQRLLVVTEPGDINVKIGQVSSASGTPGNDSLEVWKKATENHNREMGTFRRAAETAKATDKAKAEQLLAKVDSIHKAYKQYTRQMGAAIGKGALGDFLTGLYPTSYPKRMPDGTIDTVYVE